VDAGHETGTRVRYECVETFNQRCRRELSERDAAWEIERENECAAQERAERERAEIAANAAAERRIAELEAEMLDLARGCNAAVDALQNELSRVTSENADLRLKQSQRETTLAELRLTLATNGKAVVDLPNPARVN
jgi:hypothetical protein